VQHEPNVAGEIHLKKEQIKENDSENKNRDPFPTTHSS